MNKEKPQVKNESAPALEMARQALGRVKELDLTPEEKEEVMQMIDQAKKEESSGNKAKALVVYNELLRKLKERKNPVSEVIKFTTPEGKEINIDLGKELEYWSDFYNEIGLDWIKMPKRITLSQEQKETLVKGALALCPNGHYEKLKLLIIPEGIADKSDDYRKLTKLVSKNFKVSLSADPIYGLENKPGKLKLILVKDAKELRNDKVYQNTANLSFNDLTAEGGLFERKGLQSIDVATYLIWQMEAKLRTGELLDKMSQVWLTENKLPQGIFPETRELSSYVVGDKLFFERNNPDYYAPQLGCRLACTVEIE